MTNKPEKPPAYPVVPQSVINPLNPRERIFHHGHYGMTMRDAFAIAALQGLTASHLFSFNNAKKNQTTAASVAACAYPIANAMLAERDKHD